VEGQKSNASGSDFFFEVIVIACSLNGGIVLLFSEAIKEYSQVKPGFYMFSTQESQKLINFHFKIIIIFVSVCKCPPEMLRYVFQYKFSILLAIVIASLSLAPSGSFPFTSIYLIPYIDKFVHIVMYGSLGFVALVECRCTNLCHKLHAFILFCILLASLLIEVLQATIISSRGAEWYDLLANFLGLLAAYIAFRLIGSWKIFRFLKF
jgi:VanZ family protein